MSLGYLVYDQTSFYPKWSDHCFPLVYKVKRDNFLSSIAFGTPSAGFENDPFEWKTVQHPSNPAASSRYNSEHGLTWNPELSPLFGCDMNYHFQIRQNIICSIRNFECLRCFTGAYCLIIPLPGINCIEYMISSSQILYYLQYLKVVETEI